ncbi:hypothetical protein HYN51_03880 [Limnobaculum parvum]|uniref:Uncharacterized protein n=1 Tax=Limnobaculum parvum TaxID=2172103 RepID=A0A2Y9TVP8_9GAMM|nr:hypothetical protein HYN51_03880 [Limnobaculum parvum]
MNLHNWKKSILTLIYLCFLMCIPLLLIGVFSYFLKGWFIWDFDKPFPFGKEEIVTILKISLLGFPIGLVLWLFYYRNS